MANEIHIAVMQTPFHSQDAVETSLSWLTNFEVALCGSYEPMLTDIVDDCTCSDCRVCLDILADSGLEYSMTRKIKSQTLATWQRIAGTNRFKRTHLTPKQLSETRTIYLDRYALAHYARIHRPFLNYRRKLRWHTPNRVVFAVDEL